MHMDMNAAVSFQFEIGFATETHLWRMHAFASLDFYWKY